MPLVLPEAVVVPSSSKGRILVASYSQIPRQLVEHVQSHGFAVESAALTSPISFRARNLLSHVDIVLLDVTTNSREEPNTAQELMSTIGICSPRPRVLCFSTIQRNPQFVLQIERLGARYVRIVTPENLVDAVELLLAEMNDFERNGPQFEIVHLFAQGPICAPGEEISAVLLPFNGRSYQLPLGLAQRFVFDFLAQRRLAVDSLQIVSGLAGSWFFKDHALNSGQRQVRKIRRATVKVLVQRIREAIAATLEEAQLRLDPRDVLRSCYAEGTKRVLYKLHADIRWRHM